MKHLLCVVALAVAGCGIPNDKAIGELDDKEREKICKKIDESSATCTIEGATLELERTEATCLQSLKLVSSSCSFTVGEFEDCSSEEICSAIANPDCQLPSDCL